MPAVSGQRSRQGPGWTSKRSWGSGACAPDEATQGQGCAPTGAPVPSRQERGWGWAVTGGRWPLTQGLASAWTLSLHRPCWEDRIGGPGPGNVLNREGSARPIRTPPPRSPRASPCSCPARPAPRDAAMSKAIPLGTHVVHRGAAGVSVSPGAQGAQSALAPARRRRASGPVPLSRVY